MNRPESKYYYILILFRNHTNYLFIIGSVPAFRYEYIERMLEINNFHENLRWCHILTFFTADTEENHYEFHEISLHLSGSALNFSVNLGHYQKSIRACIL